MRRFVRSVLVPAGVGLGLLAALGIAGTVSLAVREAFAWHPAAGWSVLAVAGGAVGMLVGWPIVSLLSLPRALVAPVDRLSPRWERYVRRYGARLVGNAVAQEHAPGHDALRDAVGRGATAAELEPLIDASVSVLDEHARRIVARHAGAVFAATAISQSGRLDTVVVISTQLRMIREVARVYSQRPTPRELWRLYASVGAAAFLAGEIQESELLAVLGAPVSAAVTGLLPIQGTDPLVSLLVNSLLDGSANGFLTLRVGAVTRRYCGLKPDHRRDAVAASASLEAAGMLAATIADGSRRVARATRKLVVRGAVDSTARVARSVTDAGAGALGSVVSLLDQTARRIGRQARRPPQWVMQETARFWDSVADSLRPSDPDDPACDPPAVER